MTQDPDATRSRAAEGAAGHAATEVLTSAARVAASGLPAPGVVIKDRFVLEERIGQGGMGLVFAALDRRKLETQDPNPRVAIKVLNPEFARHEQALIALQREARKAQTLAHPNVATVYDFDRDGDRIYVTMELLVGRTLSAVTLDAFGTGIDHAEAWRIIKDIAAGLAYAHRRGIVHADLKPGNVFLQQDGHAKILDFGISRAVPNPDATSSAYQDNFDPGVLGACTPAYATPEMLSRQDPHPSDDLYALGLIACELLGGRHAYGRTNSVEALKRGLRPELPKGLTRRQARVLQKCLSLERSQRPRDAADFLRQLQGITPVQKGLILATAMLALAAAYFGYRSYLESGPAEPFANLPAEVRQQFTAHMQDGDELWGFYVNEQNVYALQEAVTQYAAAYGLHPRNRDAAAALRRAADAALLSVRGDTEREREFAHNLSLRSEYLATYAPVRELLDQD